jgi:Tfp pilus assembly PilM family ATPase
VLSDGVVTDPELLAEHLMKVIQETGITAQEVVVSVPDQSYVKALEKFPLLKPQDLSLELQMRVASHRFFSRGDFQLGHQVFKEPVVGKEVKQYQSVLYAAVTQAQVDSINQLVDAMGLNLVAVDLPGLAAVRCMKWRRPVARTPWLALFLDSGYLQFGLL